MMASPPKRLEACSATMQTRISRSLGRPQYLVVAQTAEHLFRPQLACICLWGEFNVGNNFALRQLILAALQQACPLRLGKPPLRFSARVKALEFGPGLGAEDADAGRSELALHTFELRTAPAHPI